MGEAGRQTRRKALEREVSRAWWGDLANYVLPLEAPKADVSGSSSLAARTTLEFSSIAAAAVTFLRSL